MSCICTLVPHESRITSQTLLFLTASYSYRTSLCIYNQPIEAPFSAWASDYETKLHLIYLTFCSPNFGDRGSSQYRTTVSSRRYDQHSRKADPQTNLVLSSGAGLLWRSSAYRDSLMLSPCLLKHNQLQDCLAVPRIGIGQNCQNKLWGMICDITCSLQR